MRLNISRKNKDTGEYEQDFSGYVMMIGTANAKAQRLHEKDRIRLGDVDVTTTYNKEQQKEYVNYKCFDFEMADDYFASNPQGGGGGRASGGAGRSPRRGYDSNPVDGGEDTEEQLPF